MAAVSTSQKYDSPNPNPRLSANQLSEYLIASSMRRKSIIQDAKFPKKVIIARYDGARDAIVDYLRDLGRKASTLIDAIEALSARAEASDKLWTKQDSLLSIEAVESFHAGYNSNKIALRKIECRRPPNPKAHLEFNEVKVSVTLNTTTHRKDKDGTDRVGGVILLFSKSETSSTSRAERCKTAAVLAFLFAEKHLSAFGKADPKICFSVDVFGGGAHPAPASYKQKLNNINASCEEIALRWKSIQPPPDYDGPNWSE
jgi:hypothetical protein